MKELELKKPIIAHGETLSVLEFDEPTGKDVRELGYPYQMNQDESVRLLAHVVSKYIVRLAKVPQSSVDQMSPADLNAAAWLVAGFFLQARRLTTSLIASLTAPATGALIPSNC